MSLFNYFPAQRSLKQDVPTLYKTLPLKNNLTGEILDKYQAQIQQRLWQINSEKQIIDAMFKKLDDQWHALERESNQLQKEYSQIESILDNGY